MSKKQEKNDSKNYRIGSHLAEFIPKYQSIRVTTTIFDNTGKSFEKVVVVDDKDKFEKMAVVEMSPLMLENILDSCPQNPDKKHRDFFDKDVSRLSVNLVSVLTLFPLYDETITTDSTILVIYKYRYNDVDFVLKSVTPLVTPERVDQLKKDICMNVLPFGYK